MPLTDEYYKEDILLCPEAVAILMTVSTIVVTINTSKKASQPGLIN